MKTNYVPNPQNTIQKWATEVNMQFNSAINFSYQPSLPVQSKFDKRNGLKDDLQRNVSETVRLDITRSAHYNFCVSKPTSVSLTRKVTVTMHIDVGCKVVSGVHDRVLGRAKLARIYI